MAWQRHGLSPAEVVHTSGMGETSIDLEHLQRWIGRTEIVHDLVSATPLRALAATLDRDSTAMDVGYEVPPCWHWLYFLPLHRQSQLGSDGHAQRGGFLPPVPLPRRMWAGSRMDFLAPLRVGQAITRHSRIADVRLKQGRAGALVFVNVHHDIQADGVAAIHEEHDIVYRELVQPSDAALAPVPPPDGATWSREIRPDDVLLFRYSALTFNGHRIHYDRRYVTEVEGYPGLIVHGPLIATLLLDLLHREMPGASVRRFSFKAVSPVFDTAPFVVSGRPNGDRVLLWASTANGSLAMQAEAVLS